MKEESKSKEHAEQIEEDKITIAELDDYIAKIKIDWTGNDQRN